MPNGVPRIDPISTPPAARRTSFICSRGKSVITVATRLVGAMISCLCGSTDSALQFDPPIFPGKTSEPLSDGGVKIPSLRSDARNARQVSRSASFIPHTWGSVCGTSGGFVVNGCVGAASSPGISLFGTGRSSTGINGLPVARSSTNRFPIFVDCSTAGVPFQSTSTGCAGTS